MNKEELIQFLKENLEIEVWQDMNGHTPEIHVAIDLCGETICKSDGPLYY